MTVVVKQKLGESEARCAGSAFRFAEADASCLRHHALSLLPLDHHHLLNMIDSTTPSLESQASGAPKDHKDHDETIRNLHKALHGPLAGINTSKHNDNESGSTSSMNASSAVSYQISPESIRLANKAFPIHEGEWYSAWRQHLRQGHSVTTPSSSGGYALSPASVQTLMCLDTVMSTFFESDTPPLQRFDGLAFIDVMMGPNHPLRTQTEASYRQAIDELDEADPELLPPPLRALKRDWELMEKQERGELIQVERRINALLRKHGESGVQLPHVRDRMDRSLLIPTRVRKTKEELIAQQEALKAKTDELAKRKPKLLKAIAKVMTDHQAKMKARADAAAAKESKGEKSGEEAEDGGPAKDDKEAEGSKPEAASS